MNLAFLGSVNGVARRAMTTLAPYLKVIESRPPDGRRLELYNLRADAAEHSDLAGSDVALAASLLNRFDGLIASSANRAVAGTKADIDDEMRKRLRALGYLGR